MGMITSIPNGRRGWDSACPSPAWSGFQVHKYYIIIPSSVQDLWHLGKDPDPDPYQKKSFCFFIFLNVLKKEFQSFKTEQICLMIKINYLSRKFFYYKFFCNHYLVRSILLWEKGRILTDPDADSEHWFLVFILYFILSWFLSGECTGKQRKELTVSRIVRKWTYIFSTVLFWVFNAGQTWRKIYQWTRELCTCTLRIF